MKNNLGKYKEEVVSVNPVSKYWQYGKRGLINPGVISYLTPGKLVLILIIFYLIGVWWLVKLPTPLFNLDYSTVVLDEQGQHLRVFLNDNEQWCFPPDTEPIPLKLKKAVLYFEDKRFYYHPGIDPLALGRAVWQNFSEFDRVSGASTITMQVARLSRPKQRNIKNKLLEMIQAVKIELKYTKEEIFKLYLTHAPYGGNIIGYKAASYRYFGKSPEEITWGEAATLAVLPNSPGLVNPVQDSERLKARRDNLLKRLLDKGVINQETYRLARAEPIPTGQLPFDLVAPHLAEFVKRNSEKKVIWTTINKELQRTVNRLVQDYMDIVKKNGVNNCAVLIAETGSGAVRAYIGSNDYYDEKNSGMIDGVWTPRSSGSILKPFLYGLAMDEGLLIPQSQLRDIPVSYGAYTPYNYDGTFEGVVTAREALIRSLNAPAVSLLDEYGIERFYNFLEEVGISTLFRRPEEYGLPLILGGAEVNLWEITSAYRGLGNLGRFSSLKVISEREQKEILNGLLKGEKPEKDRPLITEGSAYLVLETLKDLRRPGVERFWDEFSSGWKIAWKTGTSYGNRDAWAVGVTPQWTIGVWAGNFDGRESKSLTGLGAAAPLLFRIFNYLEKDPYQEWFEKPVDLKEIKISARTGYRLRDNLLSGLDEGVELMTVEAPASAKPLQYSPYERVIYLNKEGTEEVCSLCWETGGVKSLLKVIYPPEVIEYLKSKGNKVYTLPPHCLNCPTVSNRNPIEFSYPKQGSIILIPRGIDGQYQKVTIKVAHSYQDSILYWYLDKKYLGQTTGLHNKALILDTGWHVLHVVDGAGHFREIRFYAERRD